MSRGPRGHILDDMTDDQTSAPYGASSSTTTTPPPPPTVRRFRRSRTDRTLAGVCGGLAESLGMDPVIVRVLVVVLTFFGGAGVIVYGACWLLMPEDDRESSLAERAIAKGGRNPWPVLLGVGALSLAVVLSGGWFIDDRGALLIALVVIGAILLARRQADAPLAKPTGWAATPPPPYAPFAATPSEPYTSWQPATTAAPVLSSWPPLAPQEPEPPRPRPLLGRVTFCLILIGLGVLATVDLMGADVWASAYPALVVAGAGAGLLVGSRYGRGRWLIPLGVIGVLALPPTVFADQWSGDWVDQQDRQVAPADTASIQPTYEYRGGRVRIDLSGIDFTNAAAGTKIRVGVGDLLVTVPANVDVVTSVDLGAGSSDVLGEEHDGVGVGTHDRDEGVDGPGGGTLTLDVEQGIGHVEVRRAAA
jgi:phage shock protein PspC (stress-responsive transcriptional regulator)